MKLTIPELSIVVLIGASGSGKTSFARKHFKATEVLSSDFCRGLVSDDENDQSATKDAFEVLHFIAAKRLAAGKLTVIDATNVQPEDRKKYLELARQYHCFPVAIALNLPEKLCHDRNQLRSERNFGPHVVRRQSQQLARSLRHLQREGFRYIHILSSPEEIETAIIDKQPLWNNLKTERGPFDIIGDIHGCCDELEALLQQLGYEKIETGLGNLGIWEYNFIYRHPQERKVIFLGDVVDRGPRILDTLKLVRNMVASGSALCVPGNHEIKLMQKLMGRDVKTGSGLARTLAEIEALSEDIREPFVKEIINFIDSLVSHYVLDNGKLVVAHAGMKQEFQGRASKQIREFALYGETTGEIDEFGFPVRYNWAAEYRGQAMVVCGHIPVLEAVWINNTIDVDTGCVYGGKLTALRYPEKQLVSVPAARVYHEAKKPLAVEMYDEKITITPGNSELNEQQKLDDVLDIEDVLGKRSISTRLHYNVTIREENAIAALEVMSRFAANPKWLIYLPPTMSPVETSTEPGFLEHPREAFSYYQKQGVSTVICEEKHMGSRCVVIVCRDEAAAARRFGVVDEGIGICYTRTGRRFFNNLKLEAELLERVRSALSKSNFWEEFNTDWVCLDCELMPWSAKAQELLKEQYAAVGIASRVAIASAVSLLQQTADRGIEISSQLHRYQQRGEMVDRYVKAYRGYCWNVDAIADLKLAPFHILATEGSVHIDKNHLWHIEQIAKICQCDRDLLRSTAYKIADLSDPTSQSDGILWWEELTSLGGEGMVVKPLDFSVKGKRGLVQPAVKCRGREYLRIIYGAEYTAPDNLERLRVRGLSVKRSLALREFALSIEALERFIRRDPNRRVHECVFGILALESQPVDPRL